MAGPAGDQDRWRMGDPHDADQVHPRRPTRNTVDGPAQGRGEVISSGSRRRNRGSHNARYVEETWMRLPSAHPPVGSPRF